MYIKHFVTIFIKYCRLKTWFMWMCQKLSNEVERHWGDIFFPKTLLDSWNFSLVLTQTYIITAFTLKSHLLGSKEGI